MALILEDGSNFPTHPLGHNNTNSFMTLDGADTYHELRGHSDWTGSDDDKEAAIVRAFDYFIIKDWKNDTFYNSIPENIKKAQCEGALRELLIPGCLQSDITKEDFLLSDGLDVISNTYAHRDFLYKYRIIQGLIKPYLRGGRGSLEIVRG